jgi:starch synthase
MPSLFEPCGLGQLIAIRYLTSPIVRETGGLKDTVIPYNEFAYSGNGFSFENYNAHELLNAMKYSLYIYHQKEHMDALCRNMTASDYSWANSARQYMSLYGG